MLKSLRQKIALKTLPPPGARPRFDYQGFDSIKSVGIVFDASRKEDFDLVKKYIHYLREFSKKVKAAGYFPEGRVPEMTYSKNEFVFFDRRDLDFLQRPKNPEVKDFSAYDFDLLIDLNLQELFPLYYITVLSKARLKIGRNNGKAPVHDLMIEMAAEKGVKFFLRNLDQYLEMLGPANKTEKSQNEPKPI